MKAPYPSYDSLDVDCDGFIGFTNGEGGTLYQFPKYRISISIEYSQTVISFEALNSPLIKGLFSQFENLGLATRFQLTIRMANSLFHDFMKFGENCCIFFRIV